MNHTSEKLYDIVSEFMTTGIIGEITPTGSGHINDSYSVATHSSGAPVYLLQRINHGIFRDVPQLMENILNVSRHVAHKLTEKRSAYPGYQALQPIAAKSGKFFFRDKEGNYWRLYHFISGGKSFDVVGDAKLAREGGRAFAIFQYLTSDLDLSQLKETLPDFHNIETRLRTFRDTVHRDPAGRAKEVTAEIGFVESRAAEMHTIINLGRSGAIPLRVTHNDTKFNNVLFNDHNRAICVVDLDTVMPGYVLYDFGDAIRTGANTGAEDEADLGKVGINLELYKAYAEGYLTISGSFLNSAEIAHLAFSAKFMTFIIGLRFLTDHIDGDRYYRIHHPGHNLQRAKAQFRLLENMEKHYDEMALIVTKICEAVN
jgi:hypothetical protein